MIKNIIFDMGNVLIQWDPFYIVERLIDNKKNVEPIAKALFLNDDWNKLDADILTEEEVLENAKQRLPEETHEDLEEVTDNWHYCMPVIAENNNLVETLKRNGYKLYLLSNAGKRFHLYKRECIPCFKYFDGCVISADEKTTKPNIEIYNKLLEKYELNAEECIFIDDLKPNCEGAEAVGIKTFLYENNTKELIEYLKSLGIKI